MPGEVGERGLEDLAANVVEEHVEALRAELAKALRDVLGLVIDRRVETELVRQPGAFLGAAGDTDDSAAPVRGELARDGPGRAGGP